MKEGKKKRKEKEEKKEEEEEWNKKTLNALFSETIQYSVVNSYISAITELYAWQSEGKLAPPLRGAKLTALLDSVCRDEDRIRRVNYID